MVLGQCNRICSKVPSAPYHTHQQMLSRFFTVARILGVAKIQANILKCTSWNFVILQCAIIH